jgi:hypothetical protein
MTAHNARRWIIYSSLGLTAAAICFFFIAPAVGYPLTFAQSLRALEIILPVFLGYLGSATLFVFRVPSANDAREVHRAASFSPGLGELAGVLVRGPIILVAISFLVLVSVFGVTNSPHAAPGAGISIDQFTAGISTILGLLTVTTNIAVTHLFFTGSK